MKRSVHSLMGSFLKAQEGLKNTAPDQLSVALEDYANRFSAFPWAADYLIRIGDDAMESGDRGTAFLYLDTAYRHFPSAGNKVTLYLRLAHQIITVSTPLQYLVNDIHRYVLPTRLSHRRQTNTENDLLSDTSPAHTYRGR